MEEYTFECLRGSQTRSIHMSIYCCPGDAVQTDMIGMYRSVLGGLGVPTCSEIFVLDIHSGEIHNDTSTL